MTLLGWTTNLGRAVAVLALTIPCIGCVTAGASDPHVGTHLWTKDWVTHLCRTPVSDLSSPSCTQITSRRRFFVGSAVQADNRLWYHATFDNGETGYIAAVVPLHTMTDSVAPEVTKAAEAAEHQAQRVKKKEDQKAIEKQDRLLRCKYSPGSVIGLSKHQLEARCGTWASNNKTTTARGTMEQIVYGFYVGGLRPLLYVYLENDVVTAVQDP